VALNRAAALIQEVAGGAVAKGCIDVYPRAVSEKKLTITTRHTNDLLGLKLETLEIQRLLRSIGLDVEPAGDRVDEALYVSAPTFRPDLEREVDLIEEVARLNGYDRIPVTMPVGRAICHRPTGHQRQVTRARNAMVAAGFSEVVNYSFISSAAWDRLRLDADDYRRRTVPILNPLTEEQAVMRTSLVPSLLETTARNLAYRSRDLALFELRPVFHPIDQEELPREGLRLTAVRCGRREPEGWAQDQQAVDFFDLKGIVGNLFDAFRISGVVLDAGRSEPFLHPGKSCTLLMGDRILGAMGEIHPKVLETYDIDIPLYLFDLDFEELSTVSGAFSGFKALSRFPDVYRDSAFLLDEEVTAQQVFDVLADIKVRYVEDVVLFDLYRGRGIPEGKKSLAIRIRYRSPEKTLTDEEINSVHGKMVQVLEEKLGAETR
jgi:phenylalanyl-tRNA synthetase beta chain